MLWRLLKGASGMKRVPINTINGDTVVLRLTDDGWPICPVCGAVNHLDLPYAPPQGSMEAIGSQDICNCCDTQYGLSDCICRDSPRGEQEERWLDLRVTWLERIGWPQWALKQLWENLEIDGEKLRREMSDNDDG